MTSFEDLYTPEKFYQRDIEYNLNNDETVIKHLKKLGYYNFNKETRAKNFIKSVFARRINEFDVENTDSAYKLVQNIKTSEQYISYLQRLDYVEERSEVFSNCTYDNFYNLCNQVELEVLGW